MAFQPTDGAVVNHHPGRPAQRQALWLAAWVCRLATSIPSLIFLTALSVLVHEFIEQRYSFKEWLERDVATPFERAKPPSEFQGEGRVTVLTLDSNGTHALDSLGELGGATLARLHGEIPLDRCKTAGLLGKFAKLREAYLTGERERGEPARLLVIDFDTTPIAASSGCKTGCTEECQAGAMIDAINGLRKQFDPVILVALPRFDEGELDARRDFLRKLACTGIAAASTAGDPPVRGTPGRLGDATQPLGRLYIASARLEASRNNVVSEYLDERVPVREHPEPVSDVRKDEAARAAFFPSMGVLLRLAMQQSAAEAVGEQAAPPVVATLESQCRSITEGRGLIDDVEEGDSKADVPPDDGYIHSKIDLRALWDGRVRERPLETAPGDPTQLVETGWADTWPKVVVLAVDDGPGSDKHTIPIGRMSVAGAQIHVAVALSSRLVDARGVLAAKADLLAGFAYLSIWSCWVLRLERDRAGLRGLLTRPGWRRPSARLRVALFGGVAALLAVAGWMGAAERLEMPPSSLWTVARGDADVGRALVGTAIGVAVTLALWADGVLFGQGTQGLSAIPWIRGWLVRFIPLGAGLLTGLLTLGASLVSLLRSDSSHYFDVSVLVIGLLLHSYIEAAHGHEPHEAPEVDRACSCCAEKDVAAPSVSRLDRIVQGTVWSSVVMGAVFYLVHAH